MSGVPATNILSFLFLEVDADTVLGPLLNSCLRLSMYETNDESETQAFVKGYLAL